MKSFSHTLATRQKIRSLDLDFTIRVSIWCALITLGTFFILNGNLVLGAAGVVLNGLMFVHGVELQHQCLHNSGFKSRRLNRYVGIILGLPMGVSFTAYQQAHLWHHRFLGTDKDREFFGYVHAENMNLWGLLSYAFNYKRFPTTAMAVIDKLRQHGLKDAVQSHILVEYLFTIFFFVAIAAACVGCKSSIIISAWIFPLVLVSEPVHNLIELPEHINCNRVSRSALENTRTIESNWFMAWFTNFNNYHVEHHKNPGVPMQLMPSIHREIRNSILHFDRNYFVFFSKLLLQSNAKPKISEASNPAEPV